MATKQTGRNGKQGNTWRARVKHGGRGAREVYLGSFSTKEEAEQAEREYRESLNGEPSFDLNEYLKSTR